MHPFIIWRRITRIGLQLELVLQEPLSNKTHQRLLFNDWTVAECSIVLYSGLDEEIKVPDSGGKKGRH